MTWTRFTLLPRRISPSPPATKTHIQNILTNDFPDKGHQAMGSDYWDTRKNKMTPMTIPTSTVLDILKVMKKQEGG